VEEEGVAGTGGEGWEGVAEGVIVAEKQIAVLWAAWVEPAAVLEEEVAGGAVGGGGVSRARSFVCDHVTGRIGFHDSSDLQIRSVGLIC
jgi:hypothetical protein